MRDNVVRMRVGVCVCARACVSVCVCVCVEHLNRCKISISVISCVKGGATAHLPMLPNEAMEDVVEGFMDA